MSEDERAKDLVLDAQPGVVRVIANAPSIVIAGTDPATGEHRIAVKSPGTESETRLSTTSNVTITVRGVSEIGRAGEQRLFKTLRQRWEKDGHTVKSTQGQDSRGEDLIVHVDDERYTLQCVTAGSQPFFREASRGRGDTSFQLDEAVEWVRAALDAKNAIDDKDGTILAVDVRHAGALASSEAIVLYLQLHGDPAPEYGFASVWLVGPTTAYCTRLGSGRP